MTKESIIELQRIDCNCSDCKYMVRDLLIYQSWEVWRLRYQQELFGGRKARAIDNAFELLKEEPQNEAYKRMLEDAFDMVFQFDKNKINYGHCSRFDSPVSFIPNTCQIETQHCFLHRKD